jgi:uncharacterized protein YidB (DUF937 family)
MGLLDDLLAGMLSQGGLGSGPQTGPQSGSPAGQPDPRQPDQPQITRSQLAGLAQAAIAMLNDPRVGGIDGILRRCQQAGLGDIVSSWIGTGQNQPIDPRQLQEAMPDEVSDVSRQAGVGTQQGGSVLAQLLPYLVDRLTPNGRVPQQDQMGQLSTQLLQSLLR